MGNVGDKETYTVFLLVEHKRSNGPTGIGMVAGLAADTNSSMADAKMVDGTRDSTRRGRHCISDDQRR